MVRGHYEHFFPHDAEFHAFKGRVFELCEFIYDELGVREIRGSYPHKVGLHQSCHGLRELRLGKSSERADPPFNKVRTLLSSLSGIEFVELKRADECCGFGGTFSVTEEDVSVMMGRDRLADHLAGGAEVITSADMSCLMHLDGLIRREKLPLKVKHVAQVLCGEP